MFKKFLEAAILFILLAVGMVLWEIFIVFDGSSNQYVHKYRAYEQAADIGNAQVLDIAGRQMPISQLVTKPSIIMIWASWCGVCASEMAKVTAFANSHGSKDVNMLFIALPNEHPSDLIRFMRQHAPDASVDVYRSADASIMKTLGLRGVPSYLAVNEQAQVVATMRPNWNKPGSLIHLLTQ